MKKTLPITILFTSVLALTTLSGYSGGAAATNDRGYTGAPSAGGGTEGNCGSCHRGGPYGDLNLDITFDDGSGNAVLLDSYRPGTTYRVSVALAPATGAPVGYGFQSQFLLDINNTPAGTLANPGDLTQVSTTSAGRVYAEQSNRNPDGVFTFDWTAPDAGSGNVSFYAIGNAVNGNGGTTGDNGLNAPIIVNLSEADPVSLRGTTEPIPFTLAPNPTSDISTLDVEIATTGLYQLGIFNVVGRRVQQRELNLTSGKHSITVDAGDLQRGVYVVRLEGQGSRLGARLVRR